MSYNIVNNSIAVRRLINGFYPYDYYGIYLSSNSIIDTIYNSIVIPDSSMFENSILIDMLMLTGNESNRFAVFNTRAGRLVLDSAKNVSVPTIFRDMTVSFLHDNYDHYVKNSILTSEQKDLVLRKIIF